MSTDKDDPPKTSPYQLVVTDATSSAHEKPEGDVTVRTKVAAPGSFASQVYHGFFSMMNARAIAKRGLKKHDPAPPESNLPESSHPESNNPETQASPTLDEETAALFNKVIAAQGNVTAEEAMRFLSGAAIPMIDPQTRQAVIDPATGYPMQQLNPVFQEAYYAQLSKHPQIAGTTQDQQGAFTDAMLVRLRAAIAAGEMPGHENALMFLSGLGVPPSDAEEQEAEAALKQIHDAQDKRMRAAIAKLDLTGCENLTLPAVQRKVADGISAMLGAPANQPLPVFFVNEEHPDGQSVEITDAGATIYLPHVKETPYVFQGVAEQVAPDGYYGPDEIAKLVSDTHGEALQKPAPEGGTSDENEESGPKRKPTLIESIMALFGFKPEQMTAMTEVCNGLGLDMGGIFNTIVEKVTGFLGIKNTFNMAATGDGTPAQQFTKEGQTITTNRDPQVNNAAGAVIEKAHDKAARP